jgi:hypothetical protein
MTSIWSDTIRGCAGFCSRIQPYWCWPRVVCDFRYRGGRALWLVNNKAISNSKFNKGQHHHYPFVAGVMWGEVLVSTDVELSDLGDEHLKNCAERVCEINYNPIVFPKTTPPLNR